MQLRFPKPLNFENPLSKGKRIISGGLNFVFKSRRNKLIAMILAVLVAVPMGMALAETIAPAGPQTIQSDKTDYAPGETVFLTGSSWQPYESVNIFVNDDEGQTWSHTADVTADGSGNIQDYFTLPNTFVALYSVTATG